MYQQYINDFRLIYDFDKMVFDENEKSVDFLRWHVHKDAFVVTHHFPTKKSIATHYVNNPLNMFFMCDMEDLILERKPRMWVHGHTHSSFNYMLDETHIVCNPLGYVGHEINQEFIPNLLFEV
jgi:calcineurin-like phosphoesterase family protein